MIQRLTKCPLCESGLFLNHQSVKDHAVTGESFTICKCHKCSFLFTNPRPDSDSIMRYYDSEDYISHQDKSNTFINLLYKAVRIYTLRTKIRWIKEYSQADFPRILDYGCGTGYLLRQAAKEGWTPLGLEPNLLAREKAKEFGLSVFENIEDIEGEEKFDVITLFHVLEHVHSLRSTFGKIKKLLKTKGTLFLALPNHASYDATHYEDNWAGWDVPRHLYHFTPLTLQKFAEEMDMKIIDQKPMVFDSYYVSLLSEKYQNGNGKIPSSSYNAFYTGFKSNRWAKKNTDNYSSILFILKKK
jgi:2-polyprenyl-3-methyl-5-hydroxy-6-metoxy-1,4-benzoquinol methylase